MGRVFLNWGSAVPFSPQSQEFIDALSSGETRVSGDLSIGPLDTRAHTKIVNVLRDPEVTRVLDPGSHSLTESDVTAPMATRCLERLRQCDNSVRSEFARLDLLRRPQRQARQTRPGTVVNFPDVPARACWHLPLTLKAVGRAAAKPESVTIEDAQSAEDIELEPGSTVRICSNTLDPVGKCGQWVILAGEDVSVVDGDLAAIEMPRGGRLLRRVWSDGPSWRMQSINPVQSYPIKSVLKMESAIRRIIGVLFEPRQMPGTDVDPDIAEWDLADHDTPTAIQALNAITVEGDSLDPIARKGQKVLVASGMLPNESTLSDGSLAVVETKDETVGNVIKRVFRTEDGFVLVSPNPVEPHRPIPLSEDQVLRLWPLRGVMLEHKDPG